MTNFEFIENVFQLAGLLKKDEKDLTILHSCGTDRARLVTSDFIEEGDILFFTNNNGSVIDCEYYLGDGLVIARESLNYPKSRFTVQQLKGRGRRLGQKHLRLKKDCRRILNG